MKTTVSSKGQIVLPVELRQQDRIEAGQELDVERPRRACGWAALLAGLRSSGRAMPIKDSLIAATALVHGLVVATRNRTDFGKPGSRSSIRSVSD